MITLPYVCKQIRSLKKSGGVFFFGPCNTETAIYTTFAKLPNFGILISNTLPRPFCISTRVHLAAKSASQLRHVTFVRPSVRLSASISAAPTGRNFEKFYFWESYKKICRETQNLVKIGWKYVTLCSKT
jgi:hypothetical protein